MELEIKARNKCSRRRKLSSAAAAAAKGLGPGPTVGGQDPPLPGADLISNLPDAVLGDIISLLPTKEGARTQVLASRWRHLWRFAPLNLHYRPFLFSREGLNVTVSRVLAAHSGPGRRFCAPVYHLSNDRAESWLQSPALDNLQELELCSYDCNLWLPPTMLKPPPPAAFRFSNTLCVATIGNCHLSDSTVQGLHFPMLQKLALTWVSISESTLHAMIDGCPILESLLIQNSSGFCCVRINSISIRKIGVKTFVGHRELPFGELIIENAPCLESLLQLGSNDGLHVSVISAPKLEALGYLSSSAYSARVSFDSTVIQGLHVDSLTSVVRTIKILAIDMHALSLDDVLHLMRCFPCLEKLYIQSTGPGKTNVWRRKHRTLVRSLDIRVKTIAWQYYRGIKSHIDFATFFVQNAGVLELMTFGVNRKDYNEAFFAQQCEMLQVDRRASRGARLRFTSEWSYNYIRESSVHDLDPADPFERTHPLKGDTSFVLC